jgi:hypothetical protein
MHVQLCTELQADACACLTRTPLMHVQLCTGLQADRDPRIDCAQRTLAPKRSASRGKNSL